MKNTLYRALSIAAGFVFLAAVPVSAQDTKPVDPPVSAEDSKPVDPPVTRKTLTGDWFGYGPGMREAGLDLRLEWSQFYQGMVDGDESDPNTWQYGGRLDGLAKVDLSKWGLWDGFSLTGEGNLNYGESVNGFSGTAFPINTALFFPDVNNIGEKEVNRAEVSAFYVTQQFNDLVTASAGKTNNATEAIRYRPMFGGGGVDTFWNLNPAVTSSGLVPAATYDAKVSIKTDPVSFSFMVYDPVDGYNKDLFTDMFENGIGLNGGATLKTSIAGRTGYYGISGSYSSAENPDFSDVIVQGPTGAVINSNISNKRGAWAVALTMQQYLFQDPDNPRRGWGIFGALTRSDGNPTPFKLSYMFGIGGSSFIPNRPDDRFGIAFSRFGVGDVPQKDIDVFNVENEYTLEAFYNFAVTPWFRITGDVQYVQPAGGSYSDGLFFGIGTYINF